jgi:putative FmdB family regulatory protein
MPLYEYECRSCGPFREWQSISNYQKPAKCPECRRSAKRSIATPTLGMDSGLRNAHAINERSADEPRVVRRRRGDPIPQHNAHADLLRVREERSKRGREPRKAKAHAAHHPWMVGH